MVRSAVRVLVRVAVHRQGMRRHPTCARPSTATPASLADDWLKLVPEDEIVLTPEAATVLARIVREHLDQTRPVSTPSATRHTSAAH